MNILCLVERTPRDMLCFDKSYRTLDEVRMGVEVNKELTIIAETIDEEVYVANFSLMMVELKDISLFPSWTELEAYLTTTIMSLYETTPIVPNHMFTVDTGKIIIVESPINTTENTTSPLIVSVQHQLNMGMDFGTRDEPNLRNNPMLKHRLTDVIFKNTGADPVVNFDNCIPIINGKVHYPVPFEEELFAVDGTRVLRSADSENLGILLLDFTPMGGMETVRFKDCEVVSDVHGYTYRLPDGKTFADKNFVVVIAGRLVMSTEVDQLDDTTLKITPERINIENIRLSNKILEGSYMPGTNTVEVTESISSYMDGLIAEDHYESYIIIIDNPDVAIHFISPLMTISPRMLKFPGRIGGLLMRKMTREIVDYNREFDSDGSIVRIPQTKMCNRLIVDAEDNLMEIAYSGSVPPGFDHSIGSDDDGWAMIDLIGKEI